MMVRKLHYAWRSFSALVLLAAQSVATSSSAWAQEAPVGAEAPFTSPVVPAAAHSLQGTWGGVVFKQGESQPFPVTLTFTDTGHPLWSCGNKQSVALTRVGQTVGYKLKGGGGKCTVLALEVGRQRVAFELQDVALRQSGDVWRKSTTTYRRQLMLERDGLRFMQTTTTRSNTDGMTRGSSSTLVLAGQGGGVERFVGMLPRR